MPRNLNAKAGIHLVEVVHIKATWLLMLEMPVVEKNSTFFSATAGKIGPSSPEVNANDSIRDGLRANEKQSPATETHKKSNFSGNLLKSVLPKFIYVTLSNYSS